LTFDAEYVVGGEIRHGLFRLSVDRSGDGITSLFAKDPENGMSQGLYPQMHGYLNQYAYKRGEVLRMGVRMMPGSDSSQAAGSPFILIFPPGSLTVPDDLQPTEFGQISVTGPAYAVRAGSLQFPLGISSIGGGMRTVVSNIRIPDYRNENLLSFQLPGSIFTGRYYAVLGVTTPGSTAISAGTIAGGVSGLHFVPFEVR
jgi:hypothetical protein